MEGKDQVGTVIHGNVGFRVQGGMNVLIIGVVILTFDSKNRDFLIFRQISGHIVLSAQRIGGANTYFGPPCL